MWTKTNSKRIKKNNNTHCRAINVTNVVFLFLGKNEFWEIKKENFPSFYGVILKLSKAGFQSTQKIGTNAKPNVHKEKRKKNNNMHWMAIKATKVVFLFVGKN